MTQLQFDLDPVDEALVALLTDPANLRVHVGSVEDSDDQEKTISAPLPYVLYGSTLGVGQSQRLGGYKGRVVPFTTTYTHDSLDGCKAIGLSVRDYLASSVVLIAGQRRRIHLDDPRSPVYVQKDPTWTRPGGLPLFFAVDRWNVWA